MALNIQFSGLNIKRLAYLSSMYWCKAFDRIGWIFAPFPWFWWFGLHRVQNDIFELIFNVLHFGDMGKKRHFRPISGKLPDLMV